MAIMPPEIPNVPVGLNLGMHEFLRKIKESINIMLGKKGELGNKVVTFQDLINIGLSSSTGESVGWSGWFDDGVNFRITIESGIITDVSDSSAAGHDP